MDFYLASAYQIKDLLKSFPMAYHMRDLDLQRGRYDDLKIGARKKSPQRRGGSL